MNASHFLTTIAFTILFCEAFHLFRGTLLIFLEFVSISAQKIAHGPVQNWPGYNNSIRFQAWHEVRAERVHNYSGIKIKYGGCMKTRDDVTLKNLCFYNSQNRNNFAFLHWKAPQTTREVTNYSTLRLNCSSNILWHFPEILPVQH